MTRLTLSKQFVHYMHIFMLFVVVSILSNVTAQTNACSGTLVMNQPYPNYGAGTQIGNGTPGSIQVCITVNNLSPAGMGCTDAQLVISQNIGSGIVVIWTQLTATSTCVTVPNTTGYAFVALNCENTGSSATITWNTVNGSGVSVCPTCSDGIQNQGETGIDCGGPCPACVPTCSDGIQNQGETGVDCGGPCPPCGISCFDGIQNQGETGIDCGGPCGPCPTCFDGIQNGSETGVDCGGTCIPCSTNSTMTGSTTCCNNTAQASVYPTFCDQIGTSAYNLNSPVVETTSQASGGCLPSVPGCGGAASPGSWTHLTLENGVTQLQTSWAQGGNDGIAPGNSTVYSALFQGTNCSSLNYVDCQQIVDFSSSGYYIYQALFTGLDPNQDVWIYTWNNNGKSFNLDLQYIGVQAPPTNTACPGSTALGDACNLGAAGATFNTPGSQGVLCNGGNWGSNENTTFYSFTADNTTGSLEIQNITCNDGTNGNAQFAVWTSCANIGSYGAGSGFLGCAVGTGTISLNPLVPGQTYYIAADGFAGDNCAWEFTGTGIILPIELASFDAYYDGNYVVLDWSTASEQNNDYFTIQRTFDGREFEDIGRVDGAGNSISLINYNFNDPFPHKGTSYYRIKQTDFNGAYEYTNVVSVTIDDSQAAIVKTINMMGQEVNSSYHGVVIDIYSDGSSKKRVQ